MHMVKAIECANRIARVDARAAPQPHANHMPLFIAPKAEAVAREWAIILIAPDADVNVADEGQAQPFTCAPDAINGQRTRDALGENRARRFAITAGNVQAIMKP